MINGPTDYVPPIEVSILESRSVPTTFAPFGFHYIPYFQEIGFLEQKWRNLRQGYTKWPGTVACFDYHAHVMLFMWSTGEVSDGTGSIHAGSLRGIVPQGTGAAGGRDIEVNFKFCIRQNIGESNI